MSDETKQTIDAATTTSVLEGSSLWRQWAAFMALTLALMAGGLTLTGCAGEANGDDEAKAEASEDGEKSADGEGEDEEGDETAAIPVEVEPVATGTVAAYVSATANLVAENDVAVLSEVEGRVTSLSVDEGHYVRQGQVLARLDPSDEQIALTKAELRHENAKLAYDRSEDLMAKELVSREEHDKLTVDFQIAQQELAEAKWALAQTVIKSPFSGRVTLREIQLGQHVRPGDTLFQITDFDPLIARIYLSESDIVGLTEGTETRIQLNADPSVVLAGRIRQISPIVDTATGTVKVTVEANAVSGDGPPPVRPGSFVSIHVVRETHENALTVPREAVLRELQATHVFVTDGATATKKAIQLGIEDGNRVQVLAGLEAGENVIVAGQGGLREGTKIRVLGDESDATAETDVDVASAS